MNQPAVITKARVEPEQGPPSAIVIAADQTTDDGIRALDKLARPHRHEARTVTRRPAGVPVGIDPQGGRQDNVGPITGDAPPITDPGSASLGNVSVSAATRTQDRPVLGPPERRAGQPSSLGESSHPVPPGRLHELLCAPPHRASPGERDRRGGPLRDPVTRGLGLGPIRAQNEWRSTPPSINVATPGIGLTSPRSTNVSAYPYPTRSQPSVVVSQRCACGARRSLVAVDHHLARPEPTFVYAVCATRIAPPPTVPVLATPTPGPALTVLDVTVTIRSAGPRTDRAVAALVVAGAPHGAGVPTPCP